MTLRKDDGKVTNMARGKKNEQKENVSPVRSGQKKKGNTVSKKKPVAAAGKNESKTGEKDATRETNYSGSGASAPKKVNKRLAKWEEENNLVLLEGWARDGLSMEQIAHNMGVAKDTLYRWLKISSDISDAIKKGKEVTDYLVENALFTSALTGNVVAQIFWLKNREPDKWKDKIEQVIDTEADTSGVVLLAPVLEKNHEPTEESDMGTTTETD